MFHNIELSQEDSVSIVVSEVDLNEERDQSELLDELSNELEMNIAVPFYYPADAVENGVDQNEFWNENVLRVSASDIESEANDISSENIPPLTSSDLDLTDVSTGHSNSDSGMIEEEGGMVTNLCRQRVPVRVRNGLITETGPFIPVSLGFSVSVESEDWEEVLDMHGNPTGVERRTFRLNIENGSTESIDEEWDDLRRYNGISDGTNNVREPSADDLSVYVEGESEPESLSDNVVTDSLEYEYDADVSNEWLTGAASDNARPIDVLGGAQNTLRSYDSDITYAVINPVLGGTRDTLRLNRGGVGNAMSVLGGTRDTLRPNLGGLGSGYDTMSPDSAAMFNGRVYINTRFADDLVTSEAGVSVVAWQLWLNLVTSFLASMVIWWAICYMKVFEPTKCDNQGIREDCEVAGGGGTHVTLLSPSVPNGNLIEHLQEEETMEELSNCSSGNEEDGERDRIQNEIVFNLDHSKDDCGHSQ